MGPALVLEDEQEIREYLENHRSFLELIISYWDTQELVMALSSPFSLVAIY